MPDDRTAGPGDAAAGDDDAPALRTNTGIDGGIDARIGGGIDIGIDAGNDGADIGTGDRVVSGIALATTIRTAPAGATSGQFVRITAPAR